MNHAQEFHTLYPIKVTKRATGTVSGTADLMTTGYLAHTAVVRFVHDGSASKAVWRAGHVSASTTTYASATAFGTAIAMSSVTSGQYGYIINCVGAKRYIRIKQSTATSSGGHGAIVDLFYHRVVPSGTSQNQGFTAVTTLNAT